MARELQGGAVPRPDPEQPQRASRRAPLAVIGPVAVWIVSPDLTTVIVHYTGVRTSPCELWFGQTACSLCDQLRPRKLQHWLTVQHWAVDRRPVLACLTPHALDTCPALGESPGQLWGRALHLWRQPESATGRLYARLSVTELLPNLWVAPPTLDVLRAMWAAPLTGERRPELRPYNPPRDADGPNDVPLP